MGLLTMDATNALVATAMASIILNPIAYQLVRPLERSITRRPRLRRLLDRGIVSASPSADADRPADARRRAVVVGFGPTGRSVVRLLAENEISSTVIDLNMDAVREMREAGIDAVYGDATRPETLEAAGIDRAGTLILGSAGMANSAEVIRAARAANPAMRVLARAPYLRDVPALRAAGADSVYSGE